ncbi:MAG: hypothetical protein MUC50_08275 [Myxococcota bacterium]|nr:hypothetical protein [Myxococcota bacterium]
MNLSIDGFVYRANDLVSLHNLEKAAFQNVHLERSFEDQSRRHVVVRTIWRQLIEKPHAVLGKRKGQRFVPWDNLDVGSEIDMLHSIDFRSQTTNGWEFEDLSDRQIQTEGTPDVGYDTSC